MHVIFLHFYKDAHLRLPKPMGSWSLFPIQPYGCSADTCSAAPYVNCQELGRAKGFAQFATDKLGCHSFVGSPKRHEAPAPKTKDLITHGATAPELPPHLVSHWVWLNSPRNGSIRLDTHKISIGQACAGNRRPNLASLGEGCNPLSEDLLLKSISHRDL